MTGLRLHDPLWLTAILPVVFVLWWAARRHRNATVLFSSIADVRALPRTLALRVKPALRVARVLGLLLVVLALSRPQQGLEQFRVRTEGIAIGLVIDRSGSMAALDFSDEDGQRIDRLTAVKQVVRRFVDGAPDDLLSGRSDDRVGLVVFGGYPEARCPLTLDHGALLTILDETTIPGEGLTDAERRQRERFLRDEGATAIGDALARGVVLLEGTEAKSRVLVLLSDGKQNAGVLTASVAAELAADKGVKVYTIGIGSTGFAPFRSQDRFGRVHLRPQQVELDERTLADIAEKTGGAYFNAKSTEALSRVYEAIDELEKTEIESLVYTDYRELFPYCLIPGLLLLVFEALLRATRFRSVP